MEAQETTTLYLLKLWQWIEANRNRLLAGLAIVAVAIFVISFYSYQKGQKEIAAGVALTQLTIAPGGLTADACMKVASEFPGTAAGQRALLRAGSLLFEAGKYPEAQAAFQKFLDVHPTSGLAGEAALGLATSLDVQGKPSGSEFQAVVNNYSDPALVSAAKFALGRLAEGQGKLNEALGLFQDAAQVNPGSTLGYEAGLHVLQIREKLAATAPAATSSPTSAPAPFTLTPATQGK